MKKNDKLNINPEKLMKNDELLALKGGGLDTWNCEYLYNGVFAYYGNCICTCTPPQASQICTEVMQQIDPLWTVECGCK